MRQKNFTHAERAQKKFFRMLSQHKNNFEKYQNIFIMLSVRKHFSTHAECALKNRQRMQKILLCILCLRLKVIIFLIFETNKKYPKKTFKKLFYRLANGLKINHRLFFY
jgi:hypothetical protein